MRISDWSSDVCSSDLLMDLYRCTAELTDPLLSPMFADNLAALPPALIITADIDPLRDDGARYARKLNDAGVRAKYINRSEEHTSELQSLMRISYDVFCLKKKIQSSTS